MDEPYLEKYPSLMNEVGMRMAKVKHKQIEEFAAAFMVKVGLDPEDLVMFQGVVFAEKTKNLVQKTWFAKKNNEEVRIIERLREQINALEKRLKNFEKIDDVLREGRR